LGSEIVCHYLIAFDRWVIAWDEFLWFSQWPNFASEEARQTNPDCENSNNYISSFEDPVVPSRPKEYLDLLEYCLGFFNDSFLIKFLNF